MINRPPKGGLVPPLSGGIANTAPAPSGAGEEAEGRAESGGCTEKYYQVLDGRRVVDVYPSKWEALRSCRQHLRALGRTLRVERVDRVAVDKWT